MEKQAKTPLIDALEKFGRQAARLDPAKLERFPFVLTALFGDEVQGHQDVFHRRAADVEVALLDVIARLRDKTDRRVATAVLAASPEFYGKTTSRRLDLLAAEGISSDVFWTRRPLVLREVSSELQATFPERSIAGASSSPVDQSLRKLEQVFRYAQDVAVKLEAFSAGASVAAVEDRALDTLFEERGAGDAETGAGDAFLDLISQTDQPLVSWSLWSYAFFHRYMRDVARDSYARDLLREELPTNWSIGDRSSVPFTEAETDLMLDTLQSNAGDDPVGFVEALVRTEMGRILYGRWDALLHSTDWRQQYAEPMHQSVTARRRDSLLATLVEICRVLQGHFPGLVLSTDTAANDYSVAFFSITSSAIRSRTARRQDPDAEPEPSWLPEEGADVSLGLRYLGTQAEVIDWGPVTDLMAASTFPPVAGDSSAATILQYSLGNRALVLCSRGDFEAAAALFEEQERMCRELRDQDGLRLSLRNRGSILASRGDIEGALVLFREDETISRALGDLAAAVQSLENQAHAMRDRGDVQNALTLYGEMEGISRQLEDQPAVAKSLTLQANALESVGDLESAAELYKAAEPIWREQGDREGLRNSLGKQANIYLRRRDDESALPLYEEVESICREMGDQARLADTIGNRGVVLYNRGELDQAMELFKVQESICRANDDATGISRSLGSQANVAYARGDEFAALAMYREVEETCRALLDEAALSSCLANQAVILGRRGSYDSAMSLFREQEALCQRMGDVAGLSSSLENQGTLLYGHGDLDGALALFGKAEQVCRESDDPRGLLRSLGDQARVLEVRGDYEGVLAIYKRMEGISRDLGDREVLASCLSAQAVLLRARLDRPTDALPLQEEASKLVDYNPRAGSD